MQINKKYVLDKLDPVKTSALLFRKVKLNYGRMGGQQICLLCNIVISLIVFMGNDLGLLNRHLKY